MANETRPRRESTGTSRIRKTSSTTAATSAPEDARMPASRRPGPGDAVRRRPGRSARPPVEVSAGPQGPRALSRRRPRGPGADPLSARAASRTGAGPSASRCGSARARAGHLGAGTAGTRPRRPRRRPDSSRRDPDGPGSRPRSRSRSRECRRSRASGAATTSRVPSYRDRPDREPSFPTRDRDRDRDRDREFGPPGPGRAARARRATPMSPPISPTTRRISSATPRCTTATRTSSAARST